MATVTAAATATPVPTVEPSSPILDYPGPFNNAPDGSSSETGGLGNSFVAPEVAAGDGTQTGDGATGGTGGGATDSTGSTGGQAPLAQTGSSPLLATLSVLFLTLGGFLMVASRRDESTND